MNNLVKINNNDLQAKEFKGQRVITFKDIDRLHERVEGTAKRNFSDNKKHFVEGIDYFLISKSEVGTDFVLSFKFDKFAATGTLITESGYLMLVKSLSDDLAWTVQRELVNKYFRVKENKPTCIEDVLINSLQEMKAIKQQLNEVNHNALEAKAKVEENKNEIQAIRDVVAINSNDWKNDCKKLITKIAYELGGISHINDVYNEVYSTLNKRMKTKLNVRLTNKRRRMADEGVCKSKRDKLNYINVIEDDCKLIEGYVAIVKELAIKYGATC